ncbi:MAG: hypothetical protein WD579_02575 [Candidatus Paceibacterota bacterium]
MNKKYLIGTIVLVVAAILIFSVDWGDLRIKKEIRETVEQSEIIKANATEVLKSVADVANELSGITSGAIFNFEVTDIDGPSANFGIVQYVNDVKGERIVEEHVVVFRETGTRISNSAEVDIATNRVVAMYRSVPEFAQTGDVLPINTLQETARQFVKRVYPEFSESTLEFEPGSKSAPGVATSHFFRWNDKQFAVPDGLDMDIPPFIQVGINARGFIFSYDNTVGLYHNLSKESLRKLCGFVEIPRTDDSSLDRERGIVKVRFDEYEPVHQSRYLVLPYEPETDFEGCSESAKTYLSHLPNPYDKN